MVLMELNVDLVLVIDILNYMSIHLEQINGIYHKQEVKNQVQD